MVMKVNHLSTSLFLASIDNPPWPHLEGLLCWQASLRTLSHHLVKTALQKPVEKGRRKKKEWRERKPILAH